jgi:GAF domain-containing protein
MRSLNNTFLSFVLPNYNILCNFQIPHFSIFGKDFQRNMNNKKAARYHRVYQQIRELLANCDNIPSRMATINAVLYHKMDGFFWVGFYTLDNGRLLVGPYQGPLACLELPAGKGVCWASIHAGEPIVVPDVHDFPGHITCDSRSKSEIVIPVRDKRGKITAVLDVDSNLKGNFDVTDREQLEIIIALL